MYTDLYKLPWNYECLNTRHFRDYHHLRDDKTVLKNPHKGWYWHYIDNGCSRGAYRRDTDPNDTLLDFPGLNHLYLRIDWADIEIEDGVCDWSYIDSTIDHWGSLGYKFTFRVCTFEGPGIEYAAPKWLRELGANGWESEGGSWQPDYGDPIYLEKLERFMSEFGAKYNDHPLVEYVDIGTFGTWGEGHNGYGAVKYFPVEVLKKHVNLHLKYFPDKPVIVNDDMINSDLWEENEGRQEFFEYCVGKGLGLRDDTVLCEGYSGTRYDNLLTPFLFDSFYEAAPVDIEITHFHTIEDRTFKDGLPLCEALRRAHASYCGFHGYPRPWLEKAPHLTEYLANRLGYWYFINGAEIPECVEGYPTMIKLYIENKGYCHAYDPFTLKIKLIGTDNSEYVVYENTGINLGWKSEAVTVERLKSDLKEVKAGEYVLCIGLFEDRIPIKLGFSQACLRSDGYYDIDTITVKEDK